MSKNGWFDYSPVGGFVFQDSRKHAQMNARAAFNFEKYFMKKHSLNTDRISLVCWGKVRERTVITTEAEHGDATIKLSEV